VAGSDVEAIEGVAGSPSYMSPEQVQGQPISNRSDLYSLGAVMYELLTGTRPFKAANLARLLHQIVYATPPPVHTLRADVPDELEEVLVKALQKDVEQRFRSGAEFAAALTRAHQSLRTQNTDLGQAEQFSALRLLKFFHDFSHGEIWEVLHSSTWQDYLPGENIVRQGDMDDRLYVIVSGTCQVERNTQRLGALGPGDCFGEASYLPGSPRLATVRANSVMTVLCVSSTLLEQVSASCQLHFNRVFLRGLIQRLRGGDRQTAI
jgi:serine/threonine protein kinase